MSGLSETASRALRHPPSDLIGGRAVPLAGDAITSIDPARPSRAVWRGTPEVGHVDEAVRAARAALGPWARASREERAGVLRRFAEIAKARESALADLLCEEVGKPLWECVQEAQLLPAKVDITLDAAPHGGLSRVTDFEFALSPTRRAACRFRPHGVMAVVGPYNFPAHLPNGHIVPALLAGNTVVFKPSDKAPAIGQMLGEMLHEAGVPAGVMNVVQGGAASARRLVGHSDIDGVLFTGSWPVGRAILEANLDRPGRMIALEMGGNNAAVVLADADLKQAAIECVRCAFNTTGQRCTSTRRVIVEEAAADRFLKAVVKAASTLLVGPPRGLRPAGSAGSAPAQPVFMGPIIRGEAREAVLGFQRAAIAAGAQPLLRSSALEDASLEGGFYLTPGVLRVDRFSASDDATRDAGCDVEVFGPLLRVSVARGLDDAIEQANATRYGLTASIFTSDRGASEDFLHAVRAGCVNVNAGTAGASSKLPFGGLGLSGNHRPAGSFSLDYCAFPVASMLEDGPAATVAPGMHFDPAWVSG